MPAVIQACPFGSRSIGNPVGCWFSEARRIVPLSCSYFQILSCKANIRRLAFSGVRIIRLFLQNDLALNDGEIDFNVEQHTAYAENFNEAQKGDLVPISPIPTVPAAIFSATETSLDSIHDGAKVAVPDDAANTARAYVLLQKAGWITLNPDVDLSTVTQADITENPYNIEFTEMNSTNIPAVLDDFDYAVITGSIVYNAGIDPSTALLQEDILPHLILQVVVKEENKDAQWAKDIVAAYHSDKFKEYLDKNNNGLWFVPEELFN